MLYLIGLGLDKNDLSLKAVDAIKNCDSVYCEFFTSNWNGDIKNVEKITGKRIDELKREEVESSFLIKESKNKFIALLTPGDPLTATTHFELILECEKQKIKTEIIHSSGIYTAVAETGLHLYKFGRTTTLPKPQEKFNPSSPLEIIKENKKSGLHTLVLLDIGMTAAEGMKMLYDDFKDEEIVVCCNLGSRNQIIKYGTVNSLVKEKGLNQSPSVLIVPGNLHFKEEEALKLWM